MKLRTLINGYLVMATWVTFGTAMTLAGGGGKLAPAIITQPSDISVRDGGVATFSVEVTGSKPLKVEWFFAGQEVRASGSETVSGNGIHTLKLNKASRADAGYYQAKVSNNEAVAYSRPALLSIIERPQIIAQPLSQTLSPGEALTLSVEATGYPLPRYQWMLNGETIPGATTSTIHLDRVGPADGGLFQVRVFNEAGSVKSRYATIVVATTPGGFADDYGFGAILDGASGSVGGDNHAATRQSGEPMHAGRNTDHSVWASWVAPANGVVTFSTAGSAFDTVLGVYEGSLLRNALEIASDDETAGYHTSLVQFNALAGRRYEIAIAGFSGASGPITLNWSLDTGASPLPVVLEAPLDLSLPLGGRADFLLHAASTLPIKYQWYFNGTAMPLETKAALSIPNADSTTIGKYSVRLTTENPADFDSGRFIERFAEVQINTEGLTHVLAKDKPADAEETGVALLSSAGLLNVTAPVAPERTVRQSLATSGQRFSRVSAITAVQGYSGTQIFSTVGSGKDATEPDHCGVPGGASYWFSYQAPDIGTMFIDTNGSNFDTILAVYTNTGAGDGYNSLQSVVCDDNSGSNGHTSAVSFSAAMGVTYYIVVDGVNGATGNVTLNYALTTVQATTDSGGWGTTTGNNQPPVANTDHFQRASGSNLVIYINQLLGNDYDPDGDTVAFVDADSLSTESARIRIRSNRLYYGPRSSSTGNDTFTYLITDNHGHEVRGTVKITVY